MQKDTIIDKIKRNINLLLQYNSLDEISILLDIPCDSIEKLINCPQKLVPIRLGTKEKRWNQEEKNNKILNQTIIALTTATPKDLANFIKEYDVENNLLNVSDDFLQYINLNNIYICIIDQKFSERIFEHDENKLELYYYETLHERGLRIGFGKQVFMLHNINDVMLFRNFIDKNNESSPFENYHYYEENKALELCAKILQANNAKMPRSEFDKLVNASPDALNYIVSQLNKMLQISLPTPRTVSNIINDALNNFDK